MDDRPLFSLPKATVTTPCWTVLSRMLGALGVLSIMAAQGAAQDSSAIKARYAKTEYQVAMRDGKRLFTVGVHAA